MIGFKRWLVQGKTFLISTILTCLDPCLVLAVCFHFLISNLGDLNAIKTCLPSQE
jgi:hypothetical protein